MSNVSITVASDDEKALVASATMLLTLAEKIPAIELADLDSVSGGSVELETVEIETTGQINPATVFGAQDKTPMSDGGVELDIDSLPWDARIHSGGKSKIKSGHWKKKKGIDKAIVEQVEAELRALMAIPTAAPQAGIPEGMPLVPAQTLPPQVPVQAMSYAEFLKACSAKMAKGEITMDRILEIVTGRGVLGGLQMLSQSAEGAKIPQIWADINAV